MDVLYVLSEDFYHPNWILSSLITLSMILYFFNIHFIKKEFVNRLNNSETSVLETLVLVFVQLFQLEEPIQ